MIKASLTQLAGIVTAVKRYSAKWNDTIIETGGGTKEQQAELKRLNRAITSNLNTAGNLEAGITGVNLSDEKRAAKIAQANAQAQAAKKQFDAILGTIPALGQTATKIKQSETEFAGLLFQAFGTDGGRFAGTLLTNQKKRNGKRRSGDDLY